MKDGIVIKHDGRFHHTREFEQDGRRVAWSDRILLPGPDGCNVKLTRFRCQPGAFFEGITYSVDETVCVVQGTMEIWVEGGDRHWLSAGATYHVRAGIAYNVKVDTYLILICFFSAVGDILPDDK